MAERTVPYGKKPVGRIEPAPGQTDAQVVDIERAGPLAGREHESYHAVPPVKEAPFEVPHIPLYFWVGGIASGAWLAATAEELSGGADRDVVRAGRYLSLASVLAGSGLLIADLGRPERFLNMLRVMRARSPMSLGSWGLAAFGAYAGAGALLQAAEDGWLGERPRLARLSTGSVGKAAHLLGAPAAMFVGSYTGVLLSATATPSWARRPLLLPALFTASAASSGLAAVQVALEATGGTRPGTARRLAKAMAVSLGTEVVLHAGNVRRERELPSGQSEPRRERLARWATTGLGMAVPLALSLLETKGTAPDGGARRIATGGVGTRRRSGLRLLGAGLALVGSLAMRWLTVREGRRSAETPADTWVHTGDGRTRGSAAGVPHAR